MVARIWIALVILLLAAASASAMPIDLPGGPDVADILDDTPTVIEPIAEPVALPRIAHPVAFDDEPMPASIGGPNVFRPPRPAVD